jgi:hypothetical protein
MCKFLDVKPKSNWHVEHLFIWQTMRYMCQAYKYDRNFHGNKIPMEYLNKWNHIKTFENVLGLKFQLVNIKLVCTMCVIDIFWSL